MISYLNKLRIETIGRSTPSTSMFNKFLNLIVKIILKFNDPIVGVRIGEKKIRMNLSHNLPLLLANNPFYDKALTRMCVHVKGRGGKLVFIDVGANIGDTVSLITDKVEGAFFCIEGEEEFFKLLLLNTKKMKNVTCVKALVGEDGGGGGEALFKRSGTAHILPGSVLLGEDSKPSIVSIDKLLKKYTDFEDVNVIKVDTDGYDYKVLRGAIEIISKNKPVVFFELVPAYLISQGEVPSSIFSYLSGLGYEEALFYDNKGCLLVKIKIGDHEMVNQLLDYARANDGFYYDVMLFHSNSNDSLIEFYRKEVEFYENYSNQIGNL